MSPLFFLVALSMRQCPSGWAQSLREPHTPLSRSCFYRHFGVLSPKCKCLLGCHHYRSAYSGSLFRSRPRYGLNGTYNAFMYTKHAEAIIAGSDPSKPLFVYIAWQETHVPNEVPLEYENPAIDFALRRTYEGMAHCMDQGIGNITAALRSKGIFDKTLIVFSADNGGREDGIFGGNNYPLRGMKVVFFLSLLLCVCARARVKQLSFFFLGHTVYRFRRRYARFLLDFRRRHPCVRASAYACPSRPCGVIQSSIAFISGTPSRH